MPAVSRAAKVIWLTFVEWLILVTVIGGITYFRELRPSMALRESASVGRARVVQKCAHFNVRYTFDVAGRAFEGLGGLKDSNEYEQTQVGASVPVYYVATNPAISTLRSPEEQFRRSKSDALTATLLFPIIAIPVLLFGSYRIVSRWKGLFACFRFQSH